MGTTGSIREREATFKARGIIDTTLLANIHTDVYDIINSYSWPSPPLRKNLKCLSSFFCEEAKGADPLGLAINRLIGNIYITDGRQNFVSIFNSKGEFIKTFGSSGKDKGQFTSPSGIAVSSQGTVIVADSGNARIQLFDTNGKFLSMFVAGPSNKSCFMSPRGVNVDQEDNIYVTDRTSTLIRVFTSSGTFLRQITDLLTPALALAPTLGGDLIVGESGAAVVCIDNQGTCLARYRAPMHFTPSCVVVDGEGTVVVADSASHRIITFSPNLQELDQMGMFGSQPGRFKNPSAVVINNDGYLFVLDKGNTRVQIWG